MARVFDVVNDDFKKILDEAGSFLALVSGGVFRAAVEEFTAFSDIAPPMKQYRATARVGEFSGGLLPRVGDSVSWNGDFYKILIVKKNPAAPLVEIEFARN